MPGQICRKSWCGSTAEYARLLAVASVVIREEDSDAVVLMGGLALAGPAQKDFLEHVLSDSANPIARHVDAANIHFYLEPTEIEATMLRVRQMLDQHGASALPIWVTETGRPSGVSEEDQAEYLEEVLPAFRRAGAEKVFWFRLFEPEPDRPCGGVSPRFGLLTHTGDVKEAWRSLGRVTGAFPWPREGRGGPSVDVQR